MGDFTPLGINALNNNESTVADFDLLADLNIGPTIHCHVITGSELESLGFDYTNYKITVTVILLDSGSRIPVSQASNYVVYTNTRILPDFVS